MQVVNCLDYSEETLQALEQLWPAISIDVLAKQAAFGGDQFVLVLRAPPASVSQGVACDFTMRFFNSDGSEGNLCGNGLRCFYKYVIDHKLTPKASEPEPYLLVWAPKSGVVKGTVHQMHSKNDASTTWVTVTLGTPKVVENEVTLEATSVASGEKRSFTATHVSVGNPNCVILVPENNAVDDSLVKGFGPNLERHSHFPNRTNVEFIQVQSSDTLKMRVWERGSGETLSCGSGACAAVTAAIAKGWVSSRAVTVLLPGGELNISLDPSTGVVTKSGPAVTVHSLPYSIAK